MIHGLEIALVKLAKVVQVGVERVQIILIQHFTLVVIVEVGGIGNRGDAVSGLVGARSMPGFLGGVLVLMVVLILISNLNVPKKFEKLLQLNGCELSAIISGRRLAL